MSLPLVATAQQPPDEAHLTEAFEQGMELLRAFRNDEANVIFSNILDELSESKALQTPFALKVRLRQAEVLEKDHQDELAIERLLEVIEKGRLIAAWETLTHAYLSLARLHEKLERDEACLRYLRLAQSIVDTHQLEQVYPRLCIRLASYHRIFHSMDSAAYYTSEVLRTAAALGQYEHEATGHMLMGLMHRKTDFKKATEHFTKAYTFWRKVGDYSGAEFMMSNLAKLHLANDYPSLAMNYVDSALVLTKLAYSAGMDEPHRLYRNDKMRSDAFAALGQADSALFYANRSYAAELNDLKASNYERIVAVEEHYLDEQKEQKIEEQARLIESEQNRKNRLLALVIITIIFTTVLCYYYLRLRKVNQLNQQQALAINKVNQELSISLKHQMDLQGEVHHRVKNNLQTIISLLELQSEDIEDEKALKSLEAMSNRIYSIAAIHEMLHQKEGTRLVNLLDYTQSLCQHFSNLAVRQNQPAFQIDIDNRYFNLETLMPIGVILNELLTNSLKYANHLGKQLQIDISLQKQADGYQFTYRDNGPGFPQGQLEEREGGLGTYLLKSMSRQLNGQLISKNDGGAVYEIFFKEKNAAVLA
ncbi:MAG: sensor histidine kinase [Bacteroidota bacterium]